ncbi:terminase small subunit [Limosilactobacillus vaginalis]|uniref:Terminase small subunit n=1 Tax=Limosilactobacillus vaginalis DSM 5837 = ATCC 49540 TaxID=1423814 RepID=C2EWE2_9LACO|nr:terminase small subunit [Limosilactobacillus vaginalis]EEJ39778.1 terminase small subunit [Limosilactobacillus vaginalis DSM 5837 = ATCC 49540]KRM49070.1 phage terminase small subunit [Limosilactobacillus vaginalis DSM 5837 = ATCC 49540]QFS34338.1 terminase small subunit [Limosilactobacillus vaginalis]
MKLTAKQRLFADEYIKSGNATQSAIKAGYANEVSGRENLQKPTVKAYINAKMGEIESHKIADAREAMQAITSIARGETTETQAQINPLSGQWEKTEVPANLKTRLAAWREVLKRYPLADELTKAQLRKANADARVAEARAKALEDNGQDIATALDKVMDKLIDESNKESGNKC